MFALPSNKTGNLGILFESVNVKLLVYPARRGPFDLSKTVEKRKGPQLAGSTFPVEHEDQRDLCSRAKLLAHYVTLFRIFDSKKKT